MGLLDCVVFGRVAGATATRDLLNFALNTLEKGGSLQQAQHSAKGNSMAAAAAGGAGVVLSAEEVAKHNTAQDCWVILGARSTTSPTFWTTTQAARRPFSST